MERQYSQQELQKMRERAIAGAFEMQKRAHLPPPQKKEEKKPASAPAAPEKREAPAHNIGQPKKEAPAKQTPRKNEAPTRQNMHTGGAPQSRPQNQRTENRQGRTIQPNPNQWAEKIKKVPPKNPGTAEARCKDACPVGKIWQQRKDAGEQEENEILLVLFLAMLLMQEGAEQSLLFSLLYILL